MLHARDQSTAELQQQHVDRLNRHTIHTTSAGMAHANGPTARATVNSTSWWWWGQEQRVVLNFVDADATQKAMGATSAQIDFVYVICTSNSSTAAVASLSLPLSLCVSLFKGTSQRYRHLSNCPFIFSQLQRSVCTNGIYSLLPQHRYRLRMCTMYQEFCCYCCLSFSPSLSLSVFVQGYLKQYRHFCTYPFVFSQLQRSVCTNGMYCLLPFWQVLFFDVTTGLILCTPLYATN